MTKTDFEAIARIVRRLKFAVPPASVELSPDAVAMRDAVIAQLTAELAGYFDSRNPRFNRALFEAACK